MGTQAIKTWERLLDGALDTFRTLARARMRPGVPLPPDLLYDLALEAADRASPSRDAVLLDILTAFPTLMRKPIVDSFSTISDAAATIIVDTLRDEMLARLNSLRAELNDARAPRVTSDLRERLGVCWMPPLVWDRFKPMIEEWFELKLTHDHEAGLLPDLVQERERAASYVMRHAEQAIPLELDQVLAVIASSPELAERRPRELQSFSGLANRMLEDAIAERMVDQYKRFSDRIRTQAA